MREREEMEREECGGGGWGRIREGGGRGGERGREERKGEGDGEGRMWGRGMGKDKGRGGGGGERVEEMREGVREKTNKLQRTVFVYSSSLGGRTREGPDSASSALQEIAKHQTNL